MLERVSTLQRMWLFTLAVTGLLLSIVAVPFAWVGLALRQRRSARRALGDYPAPPPGRRYA